MNINLDNEVWSVVCDSVENSVYDSVWNSACDSVNGFVYSSVVRHVRTSVEDTLEDTLEDPFLHFIEDKMYECQFKK